MGIWDRVANVKAEDVVSRRPYFKEGTYKVRIADVLTRESRNGDPFFIVECLVLKSSNENVEEESTHAWVQKLNIDAGPGAVKQFIAAANGWSPEDDEFDEIDAEFCRWMETDDSPIIGKEIRLDCELTTTNSGGEFTRHTWGIAEQDPEIFERYADWLESQKSSK